MERAPEATRVERRGVAMVAGLYGAESVQLVCKEYGGTKGLRRTKSQAAQKLSCYCDYPSAHGAVKAGDTSAVNGEHSCRPRQSNACETACRAQLGAASGAPRSRPSRAGTRQHVPLQELRSALLHTQAGASLHDSSRPCVLEGRVPSGARLSLRLSDQHV
jgi:hypothetical protein